MSSGQKVSEGKIYSSKNVNHNRVKDILETFESSLTRDLGKYLGVLLYHYHTVFKGCHNERQLKFMENFMELPPIFI